MNRKLALLGLGLSIAMGSTPVSWGRQASAGKTVWDGVYASAQATAGQQIYTDHCAGCHSTNLGGGANQGAPPLKGDKFMENWREDSLQSLFTKIRTTMPRRDPKSLSDSETLQLIAYIMQANEFPAGPELAPGALPSIRIQLKDGPKPLPNYAIVQIVGCLSPDGDNWNLTSVGAPSRLRNSEKSTPEELQAAAGKSLGTQTFRLANLTMLGAFDPDSHKGHKMVAKGSYIRSGSSERVSVTELEMVGSSCGQ
jgi:mono/diheme cytochrome c family protein